MRVHVLTPLYRVYLVPTLVHYLEPMKIQWYPIMAPSELTPFDKDWIHPVYVEELPPNAQCCKKFNDFLDQFEIIDDEYYGFMCDDNMYEPGFFDMIRQQTTKIVICSLYRGNAIPDDHGVKHGTSILRAEKLRDIRPGHVDYAQYFIKGEIFKEHRFNPYQGCTDGKYIEAIVQKYPQEVTFLPDTYAFFNFFQPGRYTNKNKFLKDYWELPKFL